jgi:hypothetical protein
MSNIQVENSTSTCAPILSIDAWRNAGGWDWNNWYRVRSVQFPIALLDAKPRAVFTWFREHGLLTQDSAGKVALEDDQYNLVIVQRKNRMPLFAIAYGEVQS